ncbi:glutamate formimidoyltransferase [Spirochaeta isovalerica]|uniref:Formimidoyltransferase-cyclodeaminase n=1 Tax=Spirochaeta isovalerica TaxID=150 RepID=A0A841RCD2_9SPIO|nr:glutamate formimidoyltransferase [Spirochaeta isovalerica]MBB6480660.1 glutamate formiminotransferase/formiminotetrahydrofolate cyclodeaminase [Spirochaeta isovalerica]
MSQKLVECVPNFSEGADMAKIGEITRTIESVKGIRLLDVDPGADTNRTVVTFVGSPDDVEEAAFLAIKRASEIIDMRAHKGAHPRMGATDVCPFIPVEGVTMDDCAEMARRVGKRVGDELRIPVYLYENAATSEERRNLAHVRKGEYEGLEERLKDPYWKPDFGPADFNAGAGATAISAREFLIAYNISLNTRESKYATDIAFELRKKGRVARTGNTLPFYFKGKLAYYSENNYPCGNCDFIAKKPEGLTEHYKADHDIDFAELCSLHDVDMDKMPGRGVLRAGKFDYCKSIGWYVDEYERAQLSINLTNYRETPAHLVLEEARRLASERGLVVTGSEIVGLVPFQAILESGKYYLEKQGQSTGIPVRDIIKAAIQSMGLDDLAPFDIEKKVIGLPKEYDNALVDMTLRDLTDEVSRETPAPGGGSIAAAAGAMGAALSSMVSNLTQGKAGSEDIDAVMTENAEKAQVLKDALLLAVDEDTNAFNAYMNALRLPKKTAEEKEYRLEQMDAGLKEAVNVPWQTAVRSFEAIETAKVAAELGNVNSITDAAVGAQIAYAGVRGGLLNVLINLKDIRDKYFVEEMEKKCAELEIKATELLKMINSFVDNKLLELRRP